MTHSRAIPSFCALALVGAVHCTGTETGNPPATPPVLDGARLALTWGDEPGQLRLTGEAGAVDPPSAGLRLLDLQGTAGFFNVAVAPDGSANATFDGDEFHWYRAEATVDELRSVPANLKVPVPAGPRPCLELPDGEVAELGTIAAGSEQVIEIPVRNACADEAIDLTVTVRLGGQGYVLRSPASFTLASSTAGSIALRFAPTEARLHEDVLVVATATAELEAVSLRAVTR